MPKFILLLISFLFIIIFQTNSNACQSLAGNTGLITIPTAEMLGHGSIYFGTSWFNKKYFNYANNNYDGMANFVTMGYLPFVEISLRLTRKLDFPQPQALGDRMIIVRVRPIKESKYLPSIVFGAHDFVWSVVSGLQTNNFNALYLVASKGISIEPFINKAEFHLGYGLDWLKARDREFVGLFGGVSLSPKPFINFSLEYDSDKINGGLQISVFDHLHIMITLLNFDSISGGLGYKFKI